MATSEGGTIDQYLDMSKPVIRLNLVCATYVLFNGCLLVIVSAFQPLWQSTYRCTLQLCASKDKNSCKENDTLTPRHKSIGARKRERRQNAITQKKLVDEIVGANEDLVKPSNEDCESLPIKQLGLKAITTNHVQFYGFDDLFPGKGLSRLFNSNASFRDQVLSKFSNLCFRYLQLSLLTHCR